MKHNPFIPTGWIVLPTAAHASRHSALELFLPVDTQCITILAYVENKGMSEGKDGNNVQDEKTPPRKTKISLPIKPPPIIITIFESSQRCIRVQSAGESGVYSARAVYLIGFSFNHGVAFPGGGALGCGGDKLLAVVK